MRGMKQLSSRWEVNEFVLIGKFNFSNFEAAMAFINRVAHIAELQNHHPRIINEYGNVELHLTTHDAGHRVTQKDHMMAAAIDDLMDTGVTNL